MKTVITYIVLGVLILGSLFIFFSSFECDDCERLEEEIFELQCEIDELKSEINDMYDESLDDYGNAEEAAGHLYYAEECLTGFFGSVDVEEALDAVYLAMDCLDDITS